MRRISETTNTGHDFHISPEMANFNAALKKVMRVSKSDLNRLLEQDKVTPLVPQRRGRKPKIWASAPASPDKG